MKGCIPLNVVRLLGAFALIGLAGIVAIVFTGRSVPEGLLTLIASAVGALGSILSSTRGATTESQAVTVSNAPGDPVPVTTEDG